MKLTMLVGVLLLIVGCAHEDEWTKRDTVRQVSITGLMIADAVTTSRIQDHDDIEEIGTVARSVIGANPSDRDTVLYFATLAVSSYFIARALPARWRPYYQGYVALDHGSAVVNNCERGLC